MACSLERGMVITKESIGVCREVWLAGRRVWVAWSLERGMVSRKEGMGGLESGERYG